MIRYINATVDVDRLVALGALITPHDTADEVMLSIESTNRAMPVYVWVSRLDLAGLLWGGTHDSL